MEKCTLVPTDDLTYDDDTISDPCDDFPSFIKDLNVESNKNLNSTVDYQSQLSNIALGEIASILEPSCSTTNVSDVDFNATLPDQIDETDPTTLEAFTTPKKRFTSISCETATAFGDVHIYH